MLQKKLFSINSFYKIPNLLLSGYFVFALASCGPLAKGKENNYVVKNGSVFLTNNECDIGKSTTLSNNEWPCVYTRDKDMFTVSVELRKSMDFLLKKDQRPIILIVEIPFVDNNYWSKDIVYQEGVFSVSVKTYKDAQIFLGNHVLADNEYFLNNDILKENIDIPTEALLLFNYVNGKNKSILAQIITGEQEALAEMELSFNAYKSAMQRVIVIINIRGQELVAKGHIPVILFDYDIEDETSSRDGLSFYLKSYLLQGLYERYSRDFNLEKDYKKKRLYLDDLSKRVTPADIFKLQQRFIKNPALVNMIMQNSMDYPEQEMVYRVIAQWLEEDIKIDQVYSLDI